MVSGASGLKAATAIAVFALLVMSSHGYPGKKPGYPRKKPLCSDCPSLCYNNNNCTAVIAEKCSEECSYQDYCDQCKSQVRQACCQKYCSGSDGTSSFSCCPNGTSSVNCSCDTCNSAIQNSCTSPCSDLRCMACRNGVGKQCNQSCLDDCNNNCVKKNC